jgi:hypothetical protein
MQPNYEPTFTVDIDNALVKRREQLQYILENILGSRNVYFQPPNNTLINYPAIIYNRSPIYKLQADDTAYLLRGHYSVTYIDPDPEACIEFMTKILSAFQNISHERSFVSDNLNNDVYNLYY